MRLVVVFRRCCLEERSVVGWRLVGYSDGDDFGVRRCPWRG